MDLNYKLENARQKSRDRDMSFEAMMRRDEEEHNAMVEEYNHNMDGKTRPATKEDYMKWLKGYLENGGNVTHVYDRNMGLDDWEVVTKDFVISQLYGASSKNLIIENGVTFKGGAEGHNGMYFMDGFRLHCGIVPIYSDIVF